MIKIKKTKEINSLLEKLGASNIGFTYSYDRKDFMSCSCGCMTYIKKQNLYQDNENREQVMCSACGTKFIYSDIDIDEDSMPLYYSYEITQDDDEFFIMILKAYGVECSMAEIEYREEELDDWMIAYDKKKEFFFVISNDNYDNELHGELFYPCGIIENKDGEEVGKLCTRIDKYYDFSYDTEFTCNFAKTKTGLHEIADEISKRTGWKSSDESDFDCLEDLLVAMFIEINTKWYPDYTKRGISWMNIGGDLGRATLLWMEMRASGVDMNATTIEKAFGASWDELASCKNYNDYLTMIKQKKAFEEANLSELETHLLGFIHRSRYDSLIDLSEETGERLGTIITHVARGVQRGMPINTILDVDHMAVRCNYKIDFHVPFTKTTYARYMAVTGQRINGKQFDEIAKKPTLDTLYKVLEIS